MARVEITVILEDCEDGPVKVNANGVVYTAKGAGMEEMADLSPHEIMANLLQSLMMWHVGQVAQAAQKPLILPAQRRVGRG